MKVQYIQGKPIFTSINKDKRQFNYLDYDLETDVCIIGGGVTGAIAGYYFSKNAIIFISRHGIIQFHNEYIAVSEKKILFPVVIKQQGGIVRAMLHRFLLPRSFYIGSGEHIGFTHGIRYPRYIKHAFMIS